MKLGPSNKTCPNFKRFSCGANKIILNPGAWVSDGITGWETYSTPPSYVSGIYVTQSANQYTEIRAVTAAPTGFSEITVYALPKPLVLTGYSKMRVTYGLCNPYIGSTFLNIGGTKYSLNSVSNTIVEYNISGNANVGIEMAATSTEQRYIRIVRIELIK